MDSLVQKMTHNPPAELRHDPVEYANYMRGLYSHRGDQPGLMLTFIKSFDGLENAKTIFAGIPGRQRHMDKAFIHASMWKKINRDVYAYMLALLRSECQSRHELAALQQFALRTHSHANSRQCGVHDVKEDRSSASGNFLLLLPDEGSNTITLYEPTQLDLYIHSGKKTILVEYSSAFFPKELFRKLLSLHFGAGAKITEEDSLLLHTLPLLRNKDAYFFRITPQSDFDADADVAFLRHVHRIARFYKALFSSHQDLVAPILKLYQKLWKRVFYKPQEPFF